MVGSAQPSTLESLIVNDQSNLEAEIAALRARLDEEHRARAHAEADLDACHARAERDRQQQLELLARLPVIATITRGPRHVFEFVGPLARQLLGPGPDPIGLPLEDARPDLVESAAPLLDHVIATGEVVHRQTLRIERDWDGLGEKVARFFDGVLVPVLAPDGTPERVLAFAWDVTSRVNAQSALEAHERHARLLARAAAALVSTRDTQRAVAAVARLALGDLAEACAIHLDDGDGARNVVFVCEDPILERLVSTAGAARIEPGSSHPVRRVLETGRTAIVSGPIDESVDPALAALGARTFLLTALEASGRRLGTILLARSPARPFRPDDVPFVEELARCVALSLDAARAYRSLEEASRIKDEFLANISDELRSPLESIMRWVTALSDHGSEAVPPSVRHGLDVIERSARDQSRIVDELLDVSRMTRGDLEIVPEALDLEPILRDVVRVLEPAAAGRGIELRFDGCAGPCRLYGDADRLRQLFWHVVSNAVKFNDAGGSVRVAAAYERGVVVTRVRDTGRGIDPVFLPYVFDRFRRAGTSSVETGREGPRGLGLGLTIVKHLVEVHGGTVEALSEGLGMGCLVTVTLPTQPFASDARRSRDTRAVGVLSGVKVLLVEDVDDARELIGYVLESEGARVTSAGSAEEALEKLEVSTPDVLVSDIGMPMRDGYWLVRQVHERTPDLPAVALTAFSRREDREAAHRAGFDVHLAKPVEPEKLVEAVKLLLVGHPSAG